MSRRRKPEILTGIEIGTAAVKVVIGHVEPDETLHVLAAVSEPSQRVVKGEATEIPKVMDRVKRAVSRAEEAARSDLEHVFLAVTGSHVRSSISTGSTPIVRPDAVVASDDVVNAVRTAEAYDLGTDRQRIEGLSRRYILDNGHEVTSPKGHRTGKLTAEVLILHGTRGRIETASHIVGDVMGYPPTDIAFSPIPAGLAAFQREEMEQGVLLVDVGAGVTEYALFSGPLCYYAGQIAVGCNHAINDIAIGLTVSFRKARELLLGLATTARDEPIRLETAAGRVRTIPKTTVEQVVELRLQELFELIADELRRAEALPRIGLGVFLAGGGARIPGVVPIARRAFGHTVHLAKPSRVSAAAAVEDLESFLTPMGLLRYGHLVLQIAAPPPTTLVGQLRHDVRRAVDFFRGALEW